MRALVIAYVWPEPASSAAGLRTIGLLRRMVQLGWETHCASSAVKTPHSSDLSSLGIQEHSIRLNDSSFDGWVQRLNPDVVIFDRFITEEQFGWRVREVCGHAARVIDTQDLHFLRNARHKSVLAGVSIDRVMSRELDYDEVECTREIASIFRSDLTFVLSSEEHNLLTEVFGVPHSMIVISRFFYSDPVETPGFEDRKHFVFIGNFRHQPNADGVKWLVTEIWPLIRRQLPESELHLYGSYAHAPLSVARKDLDGVQLLGRAEDPVYPLLSQYRVNLAPLRFGAGIKGKITDGWFSGTPVVSTPIGAEGMTDLLPFGGSIASDPSEFAERAVQLYVDPTLWSTSKRNGEQIIKECYNALREGEKMTDSVMRVVQSLEARRKSNWIGRTLWQQAHRSTEYLSRWIELKNRL